MSTLAKIIDKHILSPSEAAAVTLQLLKAADELHTAGKLHRHISADTVDVDEAMSAKLAEIEPEVTIGGIGIDLIPCPPQLHNIPPLSMPADIKSAQQVLTEAGILLDPRQIDYYQLGALLCFMVSGHGISDYLRSCKAKADVPQAVRPVIDRALGLSSNNRFDSGESFAGELEAVISGKPAEESGAALVPDSIFAGPEPGTEDKSNAPDDSAGAKGHLPFDKLGHYRIIERIGHGGMGDVYKAYEKALDRHVAIKVLPAELSRQKDFVRRFHSEAMAIAKLDHPNIVRIYYSGEDRGHQFFAMQYVDGESLADLLARRKKLSTAQALPIIEQCLAGVGAAHRHGLIHRDIKPGNVLLDRHSRRALVTDFGVVKSAQADTHITVTGMIMGTADYIAPEQARGADVDCRADLYAFGILMYQMLSGKLPFDAKSATSMMFQHAYEPPPPLSEVAPQVPEKLARIVMKLMAKDPDDRFSCTDDVLAELREIDSEAGESTGRSETRIVHAPQYYSTPDLPADLTKLAGGSWFARMRNRITDLFGTHTSQVIEYMQTTSQQVDGAVSEYQRRRDRLAELAREAKTVAADLDRQAKENRAAAQLAGRLIETTADESAKNNALKEKQESEQAAAELAQLAAEQTQQAEEIDLRLAKVDAKLIRLRSQRDALKARMDAAGVQRRIQGVKQPKWQPSKKLLRTTLTIFILCVTAVVVYTFWLKLQTSQPYVGPAGPPRPELVNIRELARPGSLLAWGWDSEGRCNVPPGDDFVAVSAARHSLALRANGTLAAWGCNWHGQSNIPSVDDFVAVAAGFESSLALRVDGSLVAWGRNEYDQSDAPKGNDFIAIEGGSRHYLALKADGSLAAWGDNRWGQSDAPAGNDFVAISVKGDHSLALKADGSIMAWGRNEGGQCDVPKGSNFIAIAAGYSHSLALKADGTLMAWGVNTNGQCNVPPGNDFVAITAGYHHSLARKVDGTWMIWGSNQFGQSGTPSENSFSAISAGRFHNLAIQSSSSVGTGMPSSIVGFIVSFKSIEPFEPRTASELLDPFNENHPDGVRTHHFRTEVRGSKLIGHICVDNNAGKDSLAKALERSDLLTLVKIRAVTQKEFEEHCLLGQPSLPFVSTHNKEILGPWQTVDYIRTIESFNPEKPYSWGNFLLKGLTFYEDGSTSDVWTWEESWLWHPKNKTRLSYEIRRIDGAPYLFIEWDTRSVAKRENKPRYYVMKKVTQNGNVSPIAFADNLPVDGIVVRGPQCTAISVQTVLGPPARIDGRFLRYTRHGFDLIFSTNGLLGEIHLNRGFKGRLDTGISLASTKQDVFRVYGEPVEIIRTTKLSQQNDERILRQNGNTSRIYYGIDGLIFWFDGDSVSQIVVFRGRMKSSSLPADQPLTSATAALEFISTDPPSPAVLKPGEKLNVKFRYDLGAAQRVHIWAMPRTNARFTPGHKIQPSGQYQRSITRSGVASGYILFDSTAHVDEVWIYMKDMSSGKTIASILHKVSATWTETKDEEPSLVAHWKFDEGSGNIAYDSAGNSHGKVYDAKWTKGKAGGALHFDGSTDYVIAEMAATRGNTTYALWFSADDVNLTDNSLSRILSRYWMQGDGGSVSIALIKGELAVASRRADAIYANPLNGGKISAGTWYHLAFVFDGANIALYLNGSLKDKKQQASILTDSNPLRIGNQFKGKIDDVRIYNRALSDEEIKELYRNPADAGPDVPALFTLSDEALMSLDHHISSTGRVTNKTDTPGPGVEFDIYFPPGAYSAYYGSSRSSGNGTLTGIDLNKYIGYTLKFTVLDAKSSSIGFQEARLGVGAYIASPGRYRPTFIPLLGEDKSGVSSTGFVAANMERFDHLGFVAYFLQKEITNTDGVTVTVKVEAVPGVYQIPVISNTEQ